MGDDNRCFECRETCCSDCCNDCKCDCKCGCHDDGDGNILGLLILLVILYFVFCGNNKGGFFGNLF